MRALPTRSAGAAVPTRWSLSRDRLTTCREVFALALPARFGRLDETVSAVIGRSTKLSALLDDPDPRVAYDAFWALRAQAGSASDERCSGWRWSISGAKAWRQGSQRMT